MRTKYETNDFGEFMYTLNDFEISATLWKTEHASCTWDMQVEIGKNKYIKLLQKNTLYRVLRSDKISIGLLEHTLRSYRPNSFTKDILTSRWAFSIALLASATFILAALKVPAVIIELYKSSTKLAISEVDPDVTFLMVVKVFTLSPGTILSGE